MVSRAYIVIAAIASALYLVLFQNRTGSSDALRRAAPASVVKLFDAADRDGDGLLSRVEFADAAAFVSTATTPTFIPQPAQPQPQPQSAAVPLPTFLSSPPPPPAASAAALPECSIVFFYHIVKTAGTTMRTVLQRQAQLGDFEYIYTDTTRKPRWQLLMHQLTHPVAKRRIIIELHSEWGLPISFYADVKKLRALYEPLGCRVTLATVLRHPYAFYLSWFNWRASNYMPLCMWDPPRDPQSRQLSGFGLPFVPPHLPDDKGGRHLYIPPKTALSVLKHFDVVGLTERFDESLLAIGHAAGFRHLGYARLAENLKPQHPKLAKTILKSILANVGLESLNASVVEMDAAGSEALGSFKLRLAGGQYELRPWSKASLDSIKALDKLSLEFVLARISRMPKREDADCNFYPCKQILFKRKGRVEEGLCDDYKPEDLLKQMLEKTSTDRAVHAEAVRRLEENIKKLGELARSGERVYAGTESRNIHNPPAGNGPLGPALAALRAHSADVQKRREEQLGSRRRNLCGVRLCGDPLRSCVGCEPNPVPGLEPCWPSWEDQFTPDERKVWCKRSMTHPGYDEAELKARTYPMVDPIPCWQTCWEVMQPNASAKHGVTPTCLEKDAPSPTRGAKPGKTCANREVRCSPGCTKAYDGPLRAFYVEWEREREKWKEGLGIECPCGHGG